MIRYYDGWQRFTEARLLSPIGAGAGAGTASDTTTDASTSSSSSSSGVAEGGGLEGGMFEVRSRSLDACVDYTLVHSAELPSSNFGFLYQKWLSIAASSDANNNYTCHFAMRILSINFDSPKGDFNNLSSSSSSNSSSDSKNSSNAAAYEEFNFELPSECNLRSVVSSSVATSSSGLGRVAFVDCFVAILCCDERSVYFQSLSRCAKSFKVIHDYEDGSALLGDRPFISKLHYSFNKTRNNLFIQTNNSVVMLNVPNLRRKMNSSFEKTSETSRISLKDCLDWHCGTERKYSTAATATAANKSTIPGKGHTNINNNLMIEQINFSEFLFAPYNIRHSTSSGSRSKSKGSSYSSSYSSSASFDLLFCQSSGGLSFQLGKIEQLLQTESTLATAPATAIIALSFEHLQDGNFGIIYNGISIYLFDVRDFTLFQEVVGVGAWTCDFYNNTLSRFLFVLPISCVEQMNIASSSMNWVVSTNQKKKKKKSSDQNQSAAMAIGTDATGGGSGDSVNDSPLPPCDIGKSFHQKLVIVDFSLISTSLARCCKIFRLKKNIWQDVGRILHLEKVSNYPPIVAAVSESSVLVAESGAGGGGGSKRTKRPLAADTTGPAGGDGSVVMQQQQPSISGGELKSSKRSTLQKSNAISNISNSSSKLHSDLCMSLLERLSKVESSTVEILSLIEKKTQVANDLNSLLIADINRENGTSFEIGNNSKRNSSKLENLMELGGGGGNSSVKYDEQEEMSYSILPASAASFTSTNSFRQVYQDKVNIVECHYTSKSNNQIELAILIRNNSDFPIFDVNVVISPVVIDVGGSYSSNASRSASASSLGPLLTMKCGSATYLLPKQDIIITACLDYSRLTCSKDFSNFSDASKEIPSSICCMLNTQLRWFEFDKGTSPPCAAAANGSGGGGGNSESNEVLNKLLNLLLLNPTRACYELRNNILPCKTVVSFGQSVVVPLSFQGSLLAGVRGSHRRLFHTYISKYFPDLICAKYCSIGSPEEFVNNIYAILTLATASGSFSSPLPSRYERGGGGVHLETASSNLRSLFISRFDVSTISSKNRSISDIRWNVANYLAEGSDDALLEKKEIIFDPSNTTTTSASSRSTARGLPHASLQALIKEIKSNDYHPLNYWAIYQDASILKNIEDDIWRLQSSKFSRGFSLIGVNNGVIKHLGSGLQLLLLYIIDEFRLLMKAYGKSSLNPFAKDKSSGSGGSYSKTICLSPDLILDFNSSLHLLKARMKTNELMIELLESIKPYFDLR